MVSRLWSQVYTVMSMVSGPNKSKVCQVQVCQAKSAYGVESILVLQRRPMRFSDPRGKTGKALAWRGEGEP